MGESSIKKFIKSSGIYFVGSVLTKIVSFLLLPLYTYMIPSAEYGYYTMSVSAVNVLAPVVCLEIWSAIMRFMFDYNDNEGKFKPIFNGFVILSASLVVFTSAFALAGVFTDLKSLLLIFLYGLGYIFHTVYTYVARALGYNKIFAISGIIGSVVTSVSNIIMILGFKMTLDSLYLAMILGFFTQVIFMECFIHLFSNISFKLFDRKMIRRMIKFSLPLSVNSAFFWFLSGFNTFAVSWLISDSANGIYGVAAKFTVALSLLSTCFSMAWQELVYANGNQRDNSKLYTVASNYYIQFLCFGMLILIPAVNVLYQVFPSFIGADYRESFFYIPLYLIATSASIYCTFLGNIFAAEKKTAEIMISTIAGAVVNVVLMLTLVGKLGIQSANIALFCGFMVNIIIRMILLRVQFKMKTNLAVVAILAVLFAGEFYVYYYCNFWVNIAYAAGCGVVALFIFKDLLKKGKQTLLSRIKKPGGGK